jgi:hypothetical protein
MRSQLKLTGKDFELPQTSFESQGNLLDDQSRSELAKQSPKQNWTRDVIARVVGLISVLALLSVQVYSASRAFFFARTEMNTLAAFGLNLEAYESILISMLVAAFFVALFYLCAGRRRLRFLIILMITSCLVLGSSHLQKFSETASHAETQILRTDNKLRIVAAVHKDTLIQTCGEKYLPSKYQFASAQWEEPDKTFGGLNEECYSAAAQVVRSSIQSKKITMSVSLFSLALAIGGGSNIDSLTRRSRLILQGTFACTAATSFIASKLIPSGFSNQIDRVLNKAVSTITSTFSDLVSPSISHEVKGSFALPNCHNKKITLVSNYGSIKERLHKADEACRFSFIQESGEKLFSYLVDGHKLVYDLSNEINYGKDHIALYGLQVPQDDQPSERTISFTAEDIITGEEISEFSIVIKSNGEEKIYKSGTKSDMKPLKVKVGQDFYSIQATASGYRPRTILLQNLVSKSVIINLQKVANGLIAFEQTILLEQGLDLQARVFYPDGKICRLTASSPWCPGAMHIAKTNSHLSTTTQSIIALAGTTAKIQVFAHHVAQPAVKSSNPSRRLLQGDTSGRIKFEDPSLIGQAGLSATSSMSRFTKSVINTLSELMTRKSNYANPADVITGLVPSISSWTNIAYEVSPLRFSEDFEKKNSITDAKGLDTIFGGVLPQQSVTAAKFTGESGAFWYAISYKDTKFAIVTDGIRNPAIIRSPNDVVINIINEGDKAYQELNSTWLSVTLPDGTYYNFHQSMLTSLNQLPANTLSGFPKVDVQSSNAINAKMNAHGTVLENLIIEILDTQEYQDMMNKLPTLGKQFAVDVHTANKGYTYFPAKFGTYLRPGETAGYRVCLYCLFYEVKRQGNLDNLFNMKIKSKQRYYTLKPENLENTFWELQHRVPTVVFIEEDHRQVQSVFAEVAEYKYFELSRSDVQQIVALQKEGVLSNEWVKNVNRNETSVDGNLNPLIIHDDLLFRLVIPSVAKYALSSDPASVEPRLFQAKVGNRIDSRSDYYGGFEMNYAYLESLFSRYGTTKGVFTRSNHNLPVDTFPFLLKREDAAVNKYYLNLVQLRPALGYGPVPYSGITEPAANAITLLTVDKNNGEFGANPKPLPNASIYLDPIPVLFANNATAVPSGECLDTLYDFDNVTYFTDYNRPIKKLIDDERSVFVKNQWLKIFKSNVLANKINTKTYTNSNEESIITNCFKGSPLVTPPIKYPVQFILHDNRVFSIGYCNGTYVNGRKCDGVFSGQDVRCDNNYQINGKEYASFVPLTAEPDLTTVVVDSQDDIKCNRIENDNFKCIGLLTAGECAGKFVGVYDDKTMAQQFENSIDKNDGNYKFVPGNSTNKTNSNFRTRVPDVWNSDNVCELSWGRKDTLCHKANTSGFGTFNISNQTAYSKVEVYCEGYLNVKTMVCDSGLWKSKQCTNSYQEPPEAKSCSGNYTEWTCPNGGSLSGCPGVTPIVCIGKYSNGVCEAFTQIPIININATHWLKGDCNETIKDNKCIGTFIASPDQVVICTGKPNLNRTDYDACKPDRTKSFERCNGITSEKGCEGFYRQDVTIGSEKWYYQSVEKSVYNYTTHVGAARFVWYNPDQTGPKSEISKRVRCKNRSEPRNIAACDAAQYIWFDDQDDTGIPGTNRRRDVYCTSGMTFNIDTLSCVGEGNHTYQECTGRNPYQSDLSTYTCLGNFVRILCVNGGNNNVCKSDVGKKVLTCNNNLFKDSVCQRDLPPSNRDLNMTINPPEYKLDIYGKKFKVCVFTMPSFTTFNNEIKTVKMDGPVIFRTQLRSYEQNPVTGDLEKVTIPRDITNVSFDEGNISEMEINDFLIDGFDFRKLAIDDNCKLVKVQIKEFLLKRSVFNSLEAVNGVIQNVQQVTNSASTLEGQKQISLINNFGFKKVSSPLAYGEIYTRNTVFYLPYISKTQIEKYLTQTSANAVDTIVVPQTADNFIINPFTIGITADKKDIFLAYKTFNTRSLNLDLMTLSDWLLSSQTIEANPSVVSKLLDNYTIDERLYKLYGNPPKP